MIRLAIMLLAAPAFPIPAAVLVTYESGVEAYAEAFAGLEASLGQGQFRSIDLSSGGAAGGLSAKDVSVVVAVGARALQEVRSSKTAAPVVAIMVPGAAEGATNRVDLEVPLAARLAAMRELYPKRLRVGIIRGPAHARERAEEMEQQARKEGYAAVVVESAGPAQLLKAVAALQGKVDFLLTSPDAELYNAATIKPLVLASLENRVPIIGFSPALVRAGAAAGIFPDYRATGAQAAQMATRLARGEPVADSEPPQHLRVAVNIRVARLLGAEFRTNGTHVEVLR